MITRLGGTDPDLAKALRVTRKTINEWKLQHTAFRDAIKEGKDYTDSGVVESLLERALGSEFISEVHEKPMTYMGKPIIDPKTGEVLIDRTIKTSKIPPETAACIFWLCNRRKLDWVHVNRIEVTGKGGEPVKTEHKIAVTDYAEIARILVDAGVFQLPSEGDADPAPDKILPS